MANPDKRADEALKRLASERTSEAKPKPSDLPDSTLRIMERMVRTPPKPHRSQSELKAGKGESSRRPKTEKQAKP